MINEWTSNPMFGVVLCIFAMELGQWLNRKTKSPFCNPLLVAVALVIAALQVFHIPLENFNQGGDVIPSFWPRPPRCWACRCTASGTY